MPEVKVLVEAGKATAAAPLGPALGPLGVNIGEIVGEINNKTQPFAGMKVPVTIEVDSATKDYKISVGSPPVSAMITKELGLKSGAANPKEQKIGNLSVEQLKKVAEGKMPGMNSFSLRSAVREVAGACVSMGVTIDGKEPKVFLKQMSAGAYDKEFQ